MNMVRILAIYLILNVLSAALLHLLAFIRSTVLRELYPSLEPWTRPWSRKRVVLHYATMTWCGLPYLLVSWIARSALFTRRRIHAERTEPPPEIQAVENVAEEESISEIFIH